MTRTIKSLPIFGTDRSHVKFRSPNSTQQLNKYISYVVNDTGKDVLSVLGVCRAQVWILLGITV